MYDIFGIVIDEDGEEVLLISVEGVEMFEMVGMFDFMIV